MKKKMMMALIAGCGLFLLTGCGGNKLNCEINRDSFLNGKGQMKGIINVGFDKDNYAENVEVIMEANITSDEVTEEQMDAIKTSLEDVCDQNASKYQNCNVSVNKKNVVMKANASIKDLYLELSDRKTKDEVKEYFEKNGFTCK